MSQGEGISFLRSEKMFTWNSDKNLIYSLKLKLIIEIKLKFKR